MKCQVSQTNDVLRISRVYDITHETVFTHARTLFISCICIAFKLTSHEIS